MGEKEEYSEGMIFGVHIPKGNVEEEVVQVIAQKYKRQFEKISTLEHAFGNIGMWVGICQYGNFYDCLDSLAYRIYWGNLLVCLWDTPENVSIESGKGMDCGGDEADNLY